MEGVKMAARNELVFRKLRSDEIDARISRVNNGGVSVLLYIDARAAMKLFDETVGSFNWKDEYREMHGSVFCRISVKNPETGEWVAKEDVGSESNVEKEKGQVSDAFKRASVKWGIGRELYTAPDIFIPAAKCNLNGNKCYDKFYVDRILYNDSGEIIYVRVINKSKFENGKPVIAYEYRTPESDAWIAKQREAAAAKKAQAANVPQQQPGQQAPAQTQATQQQPQQRPQQQGQPTQQQGQAKQGQATQQQPRQQQGRPTQSQGQQAQRNNGQAAQPQQRPQQQQRPQPQQRGNNVDTEPLPFDEPMNPSQLTPAVMRQIDEEVALEASGIPFEPSPLLQNGSYYPKIAGVEFHIPMTLEEEDEDELPFSN